MSKSCPKLDHFSRRIVARDMYKLHFGYIEYGSIPTVWLFVLKKYIQFAFFDNEIIC